jgi:hypothetical protein
MQLKAAVVAALLTGRLLRRISAHAEGRPAAAADGLANRLSVLPAEWPAWFYGDKFAPTSSYFKPTPFGVHLWKTLQLRFSVTRAGYQYIACMPELVAG